MSRKKVKADATGLYSHDMVVARVIEMRTDLYRAIYKGDIEEAENIMNLMAMVGIDRDEVMAGRRVGA